MKRLYEDLLDQLDSLEVDAGIFDAIVVDEMQDLHHAFTRFCYRISQQARIIIGQDEMQQISGSLELPNAETLFGQDDQGNALVNFDGYFPDETKKDYMLQSCYRTLTYSYNCSCIWYGTLEKKVLFSLLIKSIWTTLVIS